VAGTALIGYFSRQCTGRRLQVSRPVTARSPDQDYAFQYQFDRDLQASLIDYGSRHPSSQLLGISQAAVPPLARISDAGSFNIRRNAPVGLYTRLVLRCSRTVTIGTFTRKRQLVRSCAVRSRTGGLAMMLIGRRPDRLSVAGGNRRRARKNCRD